jgi:ribosomal protein L6P/L9E
MFFTKIKFTGKGYRVFIGSRQTINFQFGYSHKNYQYLFNLSLKFKNKYFLTIFGINFFNFNKQIFFFKNIKPINIFTGRGIRFIQDSIYKKPGKISSYR